MRKKDKNTIIVLGIVGVLLIALAECMLITNHVIVAMVAIAAFVADCFGMVAVAGHKDDQTANIEFMSERLNEQSRTIMSLEGQVAKYKRIVGELTAKNEAQVVASEPVKVEEPVIIPEPVKVEEPVIIPEPVKVEEPVIIPEPVKVVEDIKEELPASKPEVPEVKADIKTDNNEEIEIQVINIDEDDDLTLTIK